MLNNEEQKVKISIKPSEEETKRKMSLAEAQRAQREVFVSEKRLPPSSSVTTADRERGRFSEELRAKKQELPAS